MDWLKSDPGAPVRCPHCTHQLCDSGLEAGALVRKASRYEPRPKVGAIVKCKSCGKYYQYCQTKVSAA